MEYRKAAAGEAETVFDLVQQTIAGIYPHYYTKAVVDFFVALHSLESIAGDIGDGKIRVLTADGEIIGTGSREKNHITRVYVLPEHEGKGYGSAIMDRLEEEIFSEYDSCDLDASLPAALFYEHRGYRTAEHRKHDIGGGEALVYEIMRKER